MLVILVITTGLYWSRSTNNKRDFCLQAKQYRTSYNNYGYGYGNDQYSHQGHHHGHHASSRVDADTSDVLGMVGSALDNYQKVDDKEEDVDFRVRRVKDFYNY